VSKADPEDSEVLRYDYVAQAFHWLVALGIVVTFALGFFMTGIHGISLLKLKEYNWHKWLGVSVFLIALFRIGWDLAKPAPPLPKSVSLVQQRASKWMHYLLYATTLLVPVTGYLYTLAAGYPVVYFGWLALPVFYGKQPELIEPLRVVHAWLSYGMALAVVLHSAAALSHQFYYRDGVLLRMLPGRAQPPRGTS